MTWSFDHTVFYRAGAPFFPHIQKRGGEGVSSNVAVIDLPAGLADELKWDKECEEAKREIEKGKLILWKIGFKLEFSKIRLNDSPAFLSFSLAIDHFIKTCWNEFKDATFGVVLYQGSADFANAFLWDEEQKESFRLWLSDYKERTEQKHPLEDELLFSLFCTEVFAGYIHRLASFFPEDALLFCLLDLSFLSSLAKSAFLFSKVRFEHVHLICKGAKLPLSTMLWDDEKSLELKNAFSSDVETAVCLPTDERCDAKALLVLEDVFETLLNNKKNFRVVPEEMLTEQWDGLEAIIINPSSLSIQGKRKLQGFCAAGGKVVSVGERAGFGEEILFDQFFELS